MRITALTVGLVLCSALLLADEHNVTFDAETNFSAFKTFMVRETKVNSTRPELSNQLFNKQIANAVRAELIKKKMTETTDRPDVVIDCFVTGVDYSIGPFGRASVIVPRRGRGGTRVEPEPVSFTEATLVIDMRAIESGTLVWHGVYRDPKDSAPKIAKKLPEGVKKLFSEYPPKKK